MGGWRAAGLALAALLSAACAAKTATPTRIDVNSIAVRGTSFEIATSDGRELSSPDLVGTVLGVRLGGSETRIRIDAVARDPDAPAVLLHSISVQRPNGAWRPLCDSTPNGQGAGFPLAGRSKPDGTLIPARGDEMEIVCTSGAQGKCVRLGYSPWAGRADAATALRLFNACVRMMRADYSGRGVPVTRDGTPVSVFDRSGIRSAPATGGWQFEAGWDDRGAVCVRHARVQGLASLEQIEASSPRLAGRVGPGCTRETAESLGAVIFNLSRA